LYFIITVFCQFCNSALYSENKRYVLLKKKVVLMGLNHPLEKFLQKLPFFVITTTGESNDFGIEK
jgi:hypothetical protein